MDIFDSKQPKRRAAPDAADKPSRTALEEFRRERGGRDDATFAGGVLAVEAAKKPKRPNTASGS